MSQFHDGFFFCQICFQLFGRSFEEGNEYDLLFKGSSLLKGDRKRKIRGNKIHLEFWLNQSFFSVKKSRQQSMSQDEGGVCSKRKMRARQCRKVSWVKLPVHTFMA